MYFLHKILVTILILCLVFLVVVLLIKMMAPKPNQPYNIHTWLLPNGNIVKYYEMAAGHGGFTANLSQYLIFQTKNSENKYYVGTGGSHKSLKLYLSRDSNVVWIMGKYVGEKDLHLIVALDMQRSIFMNKDKKNFSEKELTNGERALLKQLNIEKSTLVHELN